MPLTHVNSAFYLLSVNEVFPPMVVDKGSEDIMTERFAWIRDVVQDLETFCTDNGLESVACEFARIRPKIDKQIQAFESQHVPAAEIREKNSCRPLTDR